jgi:lysophospholipase L1-like esterase
MCAFAFPRIRVMSRLRRIAIPFVLVACSVLLFFIGLELALRAIEYPRREARILCLDAVMGNVYCPKLSEKLDNMYESTLLVTTNSEGMADREYARSKPANTIRVALLGDSVTASLYTPQADKFKTLWEKALAQSSGKTVEIMNFGIDGSGTWEQLQMLHLRARQYQPDYVVLAFFWGNDVWNNSTSRDKGRPNPLKDEYTNQSWVRGLQVKHRKSIRWLWNNSAAFQFLDTMKDRVETNLNYKRALQAAQQAAPATPAAPAATKPASAPPPPQYDPAFFWDSDSWQLTRELILKLKAETEQSGARLLVFGIPMYDQLVMPKPLPYAEFRSFLAQNGIAGADPFDALAALTPQQKRALYIGDAVHLTVEGHRFMAEASLPAIRKFMQAPVAGK